MFLNNYLLILKKNTKLVMSLSTKYNVKLVTYFKTNAELVFTRIVFMDLFKEKNILHFDIS